MSKQVYWSEMECLRIEKHEEHTLRVSFGLPYSNVASIVIVTQGSFIVGNHYRATVENSQEEWQKMRAQENELISRLMEETS